MGSQHNGWKTGNPKVCRGDDGAAESRERPVHHNRKILPRERKTLQMPSISFLVDGQKLTELMIEYGIGVSTQKTYRIKRIDSDYFSET